MLLVNVIVPESSSVVQLETGLAAGEVHVVLMHLELPVIDVDAQHELERLSEWMNESSSGSEK